MFQLAALVVAGLVASCLCLLREAPVVAAAGSMYSVRRLWYYWQAIRP